MILVDSSGMSHDITSFKLLVTLGIGWAAFILSLIFNILYYALHPSQVTLIILFVFSPHSFLLQVALLDIKEKLVVAVFGWEWNLVECNWTGLDTNQNICWEI